MARVTHFDALDRIHVAGVNWRPVRRTLGITAFGINAYTAEMGQDLIEEHDETGAGSPRHEELYIVVAGHARFRIDEETIEAPAGTFVFLPDAAARRSAVAVTDGTQAIAIGGPPGTITPSAWEHYFAASAETDPARAYQVAVAGVDDHPKSASLHFNLACYAAQAGMNNLAIDHLRTAVEADPVVRDWASTDTDLDPIRDDPRYPA